MSSKRPLPLHETIKELQKYCHDEFKKRKECNSYDVMNDLKQYTKDVSRSCEMRNVFAACNDSPILPIITGKSGLPVDLCADMVTKFTAEPNAEPDAEPDAEPNAKPNVELNAKPNAEPHLMVLSSVADDVKLFVQNVTERKGVVFFDEQDGECLDVFFCFGFKCYATKWRPMMIHAYYDDGSVKISMHKMPKNPNAIFTSPLFVKHGFAGYDTRKMQGLRMLGDKLTLAKETRDFITRKSVNDIFSEAVLEPRISILTLPAKIGVKHSLAYFKSISWFLDMSLDSLCCLPKNFHDLFETGLAQIKEKVTSDVLMKVVQADENLCFFDGFGQIDLCE